MKLHLEVITPEKVILNEDVDEIVITTLTGEITILPNHENLLTKVAPGEMIIKNNGKEDYFAVTGGFLEVSENKINILAEYAVRASDIEIAKAEKAQEEAKRKMQEHETDKEFKIADAMLRKALLEHKVARKHKSTRIQ